MGQRLSTFISERLADGTYNEEVAEVERRIQCSLDVWAAECTQRHCGRGAERDEKKVQAIAVTCRSGNPTAREIVPDALCAAWAGEAASDTAIVNKYIERALSTPLTVEQISVHFAKPLRQYEMPVVRAHERIEAHEYKAFAKLPIRRNQYPRGGRGVRKRTSEVDPGTLSEVHAIADADQFLSGVVVPKGVSTHQRLQVSALAADPERSPSYTTPYDGRRVFTPQDGSTASPLLGRRVLLLLVLLHDKGLRAGYMKCCMGSSRPTGKRMRTAMKHPERLHNGWGMHTPCSNVVCFLGECSDWLWAQTCHIRRLGCSLLSVLVERPGHWKSSENHLGTT